MKNRLEIHLKRAQVNILKKNFFGYLPKKIWFRVCSVTAKMFELRNSGENWRKRSEIFFENLPREYKDFILVKKNSKLSHACVPLSYSLWHFQKNLCWPHPGLKLLSKTYFCYFDYLFLSTVQCRKWFFKRFADFYSCITYDKQWCWSKGMLSIHR